MIREWNGIIPNVKGKLLREFLKDLVDKHVKAKKEMYKRLKNKQQQNYGYSNDSNNNNFIQWIEVGVLQNPLSDYRKTCIWRILAPYLLNIRKLSDDQAFKYADKRTFHMHIIYL